MKAKHEIINEIIEREGYKYYLEVGYELGNNFKEIKCKDKLSVDTNGKADITAKSDDFFKDNDKTFDVVFIDALHHADQVRKDIINSMKCLSEDGVIILHDVLPSSKEMQEVPRVQKEWTGDCWRAAIGFHKEYPKVKFETRRADYGITCIYPNGKKYRKHFEDTEITYEEFKANEDEFLNIVD